MSLYKNGLRRFVVCLAVVVAHNFDSYAQSNTQNRWDTVTTFVWYFEMPDDEQAILSREIEMNQKYVADRLDFMRNRLIQKLHNTSNLETVLRGTDKQRKDYLNGVFNVDSIKKAYPQADAYISIKFSYNAPPIHSPRVLIDAQIRNFHGETWGNISSDFFYSRILFDDPSLGKKMEKLADDLLATYKLRETTYIQNLRLYLKQIEKYSTMSKTEKTLGLLVGYYEVFFSELNNLKLLPNKNYSADSILTNISSLLDIYHFNHYENVIALNMILIDKTEDKRYKLNLCHQNINAYDASIKLCSVNSELKHNVARLTVSYNLWIEICEEMNN